MPAPVPVRVSKQPPKPPVPEERDYLFDDQPEFDEHKPPRKHGLLGPLLGAIAVLALLVGIGSYSLFYSYAEVTVIPKSQDVVVPESTHTVGLETGEIRYTLITKNATSTADVPALGNETVHAKASGTIIVYNNYSSASQALVKNTRFETPDGKIYRTESAITVPGQTTSAGKKVPGSIEVKVVADAEGDKYNIGLSDFTIPGFKGDPKFSAFYGRSKTPMTGGYSGTRSKVAEGDALKAAQNLIDSNKAALAATIASQLPTGYVIASGSIQFESPAPVRTAKDDKTVTIVQAVNAKAYALQEEDLVKAIVAESPLAAEKTAMYARDWSGLSAVFSQPKTGTSTLTVTLKGKVKLYWFYNEEKLREDLAGTSKSPENMTEILKRYNGIYSAEALVSPFWKRAFPTDPAKIKVVEGQ